MNNDCTFMEKKISISRKEKELRKAVDEFQV
jgi:hypothetical protein